MILTLRVKFKKDTHSNIYDFALCVIINKPLKRY